MFRLFKILFVLAVLLAFAVVGFAYLGDLTPNRQVVEEPVTLDGN